MSTDIRKHTSIAAGEQPTRAALAAAFLSISDIVPVANATEANQIAAALVSAGQNLANTPLTVRRADAPGMHTVETTKDGASWIPSSGVLHFSTTGARDTWTTSYSAQLTSGDTCIVSGVEYYWNGTAWQLGYVTQTLGFVRNNSGTAQGSIGATATALTSISLAITLPSAMNVRLKFGCKMYASDNASAGQFNFMDGATSLGNTPVMSNSSPSNPATSVGIYQELYLPSFGSGSHTFTITAQRVVGTGTVTIAHDSAWPTYLIAETY